MNSIDGDYFDSPLSPATNHTYEDIQHISSRFRVSRTRFLGALLTIISILRATLMLSSSTSNTTKVTCALALAYGSSYFFLEMLVWSLVIGGFSVDTSLVSFAPLIRSMDPGDNPFRLPLVNTETLRYEIHLQTLPQPESPTPGEVKNPNTQTLLPFASVLFLCPAMWMLLLSQLTGCRTAALIVLPSAAVVLLGLYSLRQKRNARCKSQPRRSTLTQNGMSYDPNQPSGHGIHLLLLREIMSIRVLSTMWVIALGIYLGVSIFQHMDDNVNGGR